MSPMWLLPAFVLLVGAVALFDAVRRLAGEAELLAVRLVRVRDMADDVRRIREDTRALAGTVKRHR